MGGGSWVGAAIWIHVYIVSWFTDFCFLVGQIKLTLLKAAGFQHVEEEKSDNQTCCLHWASWKGLYWIYLRQNGLKDRRMSFTTLRLDL